MPTYFVHFIFRLYFEWDDNTWSPTGVTLSDVVLKSQQSKTVWLILVLMRRDHSALWVGKAEMRRDIFVRRVSDIFTAKWLLRSYCFPQAVADCVNECFDGEVGQAGFKKRTIQTALIRPYITGDLTRTLTKAFLFKTMASVQRIIHRGWTSVCQERRK